MSDIRIVCVSDNPEYIDKAIDYNCRNWPLDDNIYIDCIKHSVNTEGNLPRWYLMFREDEIIGSYGLIMNDFISRQDLWPWLAALFIEESERGKSLGSALLEHGRKEAKKIGFNKLYLCTGHTDFYEKYGWEKIGIGYHPWHEFSSIFMIEL
jgi:N-acetylglutamate synthase-like GNAT family acetyltransferase